MGNPQTGIHDAVIFEVNLNLKLKQDKFLLKKKLSIILSAFILGLGVATLMFATVSYECRSL